ncbi:MAG: hypothetical protein GY719_04225 [bacterium]|nr:hypothetical protein [bacterium]
MARGTVGAAHCPTAGKIDELIREIEDEGERKRDGDPVAGVEKILSQDPFEPPTRVTKRSPKPLFHVASKEERDDLVSGFLAFQTQYQIASEALRRVCHRPP